MLEIARKFVNSVAPVPDSEIERLTKLFSVRDVEKGYQLATSGQYSTDVAFVVRGLFKLHGSEADGTPFIVGFVAENAPVADYSSMLAKEPARLAVEALEPSRIATFPFDAYMALLDDPGPWQVFGRKIVERMLVNLTRREHQFLTMTARDRYVAFLEENRELVPRLARHDIAAYLGITPVSLSRLTGQMHRAKG